MSVKCGNCKGYHDTAASVKACFGFGSAVATSHIDGGPLMPSYNETKAPAAAAATAAPAAAAATTKGANPATEKQVAFLTKLVGERNIEKLSGNLYERAFDLGSGKFISKAEASDLIAALLALPKVATPTATTQQLEDGIYRKGDAIVKVYHAVHGSGQQVAKALVVVEPDCGGCANGEPCGAGCKWTASWDYRGKRGLAGLTAADKLSQEAAAEFGKVYGFCVRCGRDLTKEESIHVGYGATCAGHEGWWYPSKAELKALAGGKYIETAV